jgi:hypothetical protein
MFDGDLAMLHVQLIACGEQKKVSAVDALKLM